MQSGALPPFFCCRPRFFPKYRTTAAFPASERNRTRGEGLSLSVHLAVNVGISTLGTRSWGAPSVAALFHSIDLSVEPLCVLCSSSMALFAAFFLLLVARQAATARASHSSHVSPLSRSIFDYLHARKRPISDAVHACAATSNLVYRVARPHGRSVHCLCCIPGSTGNFNCFGRAWSPTIVLILVWGPSGLGRPSRRLIDRLPASFSRVP